MTLCIVTKANLEMANILAFDMDLMFPETKIKLDMSGATTPAYHHSKNPRWYTVSRSTSTFRTMATKALVVHSGFRSPVPKAVISIYRFRFPEFR